MKYSNQIRLFINRHHNSRFLPALCKYSLCKYILYVYFSFVNYKSKVCIFHFWNLAFNLLFFPEIWSESNSSIYFYIVLNKTWKVYRFDQSLTGLGPEDRSSSRGEDCMCSIVSGFRQVGGFLRVLLFPPPIKQIPQYNWNYVESGIKHHNPPSNIYKLY